MKDAQRRQIGGGKRLRRRAEGKRKIFVINTLIISEKIVIPKLEVDNQYPEAVLVSTSLREKSIAI